VREKQNFYPDWRDTAPENGTYRQVLKWGDPERFKPPNRSFYALLKEQLGMTDTDFLKKENEGNETVRCDIPISLSKEQVRVFKDIVGEDNINGDDFSRVKYATGKTMEEILKLRQGIVGEVADLVVHPRNVEDIQKIVVYCNEQKIPIYVYGGGSSVTMGFRCDKGGITLVLSTHLNQVLDLNEANQTVTVQPGIMGPEYERILNNAPEIMKAKRKYTGGHFPQSFEHSSVGGWIVTLGSGQQSSYYGDIYDIVVSQEYVTPSGNFKTLDYPGTATGPKVNDIMKGNEGTFGVLVSATLKIFRHLPENRRRFGFIFPDWESAVSGSREICQGEFGLPSVFRISDPEETDIAMRLYNIEGTIIDKAISLRGYKPGRRCLCIGQADGETGFSKNVKKNVKRICRKHGAMYISGLPVKNWEHGRYTDPYMREDLNDFGVMIDTLESGVTWDKLHDLCKGVRAHIKSRPNTICMTHASHFYPQGTNLYFIFIARMDDIDEYKKFQDGIIDQIQAHGGSLSHHHGVGKMMGPWMEKHLGKEQMDVLRAIKHHFDPNNIMNPGGTLGLG